MKGILNKLSFPKFDKLSKQVLCQNVVRSRSQVQFIDTGINSKARLEAAINLIFGKVCHLYNHIRGSHVP